MEKPDALRNCKLLNVKERNSAIGKALRPRQVNSYTCVQDLLKLRETTWA
jgi:hypothetical protein